MKNQLKKLSVILFATLLFTGLMLISCGDVLDDGTAVYGSGNGIARAVTISNKNEQGVHDGYNYELWRDYGNVSMTLENGGNFSCSWSNIGNVLCRKGKKFDSTKTHSQIGNISIKYDAQFTPGGNSYLCVYGWSKDPLVEYYIIESYGTYKPTGTAKGSVTIDGGTYELYETTRTNQPSIEGTKTFKQYWSVRTSKRTSGTISVTEHFKAWEKQGMTLGKLYEVALTAEGYQSNGSAKITSHTLTIGGSGSGSDSSNSGSGNGGGSGSSTTTGATKIEAENMTKSGKYTGNCSSPFTGVILYANDDKVSFSQSFANNSHNFKLRGASSNSKEAQVELRIGGTSYGTFKFSGTSPAEKTITATHNKGGNTATVELVCVNDNDTWDVLIDWIEISASGNSSGSSGNGSSGNGSGGGNSSGSSGSSSGGGNSSGSGSSSGTKIEAESMTKGGKYTGNCDSPFNGVVLYANNDKVSFSQYFANNSHNFKIRCASSNDKEAQVELRIGGTSYGIFKFSGTSPTEKTIAATHNKGGSTVTIELVCVNDNDTWDAKIDWLEISAK